MFGFWDHPDLAEEIRDAVKRGSTIQVVPQPGAADERYLQREGVSQGLTMDEWFDTHFGCASPSSMDTERGLGAGAYTRPLLSST